MSSQATHPFDLSSEQGKQAYFSFYGFHFIEALGVEHSFSWVDCGKERLATQYFAPQGATKTAVVVHGYTDHVGLFGQWIEHLLTQGYAVLAFDNIGHGLSTGERASISNFDQYQESLASIIAFAKTENLPPLSLLTGQSMGGAICLDYLYRAAGFGAFDQAILLSPLVKPVRWAIRRWLFRLVTLNYCRAAIARKLTERSHEAAFLELTREDPLQPKALPVRWVLSMQQWIDQFTNQPALDGEFEGLSVVQAGADATVDNLEAQQLIKRYFPGAKITVIDGAFHHLAGESKAYFDQLLVD